MSGNPAEPHGRIPAGAGALPPGATATLSEPQQNTAGDEAHQPAADESQAKVALALYEQDDAEREAAQAGDDLGEEQHQRHGGEVFESSARGRPNDLARHKRRDGHESMAAQADEGTNDGPSGADG